MYRKCIGENWIYSLNISIKATAPRLVQKGMEERSTLIFGTTRQVAYRTDILSVNFNCYQLSINVISMKTAFVM